MYDQYYGLQSRPFQLFPVGKTVDWLVRPLVGQGDAGVRDKSFRLLKEFGEQRRNVCRFLMGDGGAAFGVGHIPDDPENLEQPPVQTGDLLCRPGTFFRGAEGEQAVGGDHHVGQRLPQLPGGVFLKHGNKARTKLPCLLLQQINLFTGGESRHL